jgi:UDPglucose 6-dehydrogenase
MGGMIGYAGLSHLGIVSSIAAAARGFRVVAFDADVALCDGLRAGRLPVFEPGLADLLAANRDRLEFTSDPARLLDCAVVTLSRDIPTDEQNQSRVESLDELVATVIPVLGPEAVLIVLSQICPGYMRRLQDRLAAVPGSLRPSLYYQVETLIFGNAVERALRPERFIVGCAYPTQSLPGPYAELLAAFGCPVLPMIYESAELAKLAINLFLVASVTTTNTLAELCEALGADWSEIQPALRLDRRIGPHAYLAPGLGIAGGNLERDLATLNRLADDAGTEAGIIDAFSRNSAFRRDWVLRTIHQVLRPDGTEPVIALWGLAYKPHTRSTKNSPALALIRQLTAAGPGHTIRAYDPEAALPEPIPDHVRVCRSALETCVGADVLVILTPWPEFAGVDLAAVRSAMRGCVIIDPFAVLCANPVRAEAFHYCRLGAGRGTAEHLREKVA